MNEFVIQVQDVCFAFGAQEVLHNVSFRVPPCAFVAVVGPNGGGKTTLLKLLLGELSPRFGYVRMLGGTPREVRRRIGYVPQALPFDPGFPVSVHDVVLMGRVDRHRIGPYRAADHQAARAALAQVGMASVDSCQFAELSGGQRQRVLIAQALVSAPELLLLDEPTASVDPAATSQLYTLFHELKADRTIVMVSHNLGAVTGYATHVLCVNRTAEMQVLADVATATVRQASGGDLALLQHGPECHVMDSSEVLDSPHHGATGEAP
ncbi:MAG: metal ABC transporter ATP-binding protein [Kiritimatiellia bacterium]